MKDTIAAISTALGVGAISIIRVSGNDAIKIVNSISKISVYSLISNADYKAGLDAELQAHATIVEEYIARLCE